MDGGPLPDPLPLFPLQTVLFPGAVLGLKVFEARYLDLVSECLRGGTPFGVVCLRQGSEVARAGEPVALERVGTLARIDEVDAEAAGILRLRCRGGSRFVFDGPLSQRANGLWQAKSIALPDDPPRAPGVAMQATVDALAEAIRKLQSQHKLPFRPPFRFDDAGWVANRWCELLPLPLATKQKLLALDDPTIRLSLVDGYLRDRKVIVG